MVKPTKSLKRIKRQIERARRFDYMLVLHPDTVEWLIELVELFQDEKGRSHERTDGLREKNERIF